MAIKKLQNNFTTPKQSKRLLEFGVPADSADCYWRKDKHGNLGYVSIIPSGGKLDEMDVPCWSVGRLIEIFIICTPYVEIRLRTMLIKQLIASYEDVTKQGLIDFSKL